MSPRAPNRPPSRRELIARKLCVQTVPPACETLVDFHRLEELARRCAEEYREARPFPHLVIDDFLRPAALASVLASLPELDDAASWRLIDASTDEGAPAQAEKYQLANHFDMGPALRQLVFELNSGAFTQWLTRLTGINDVLSDPLLQGGGLHYVRRKGLLRVHADFNQHPIFGLHRRLNLLLYLNPDWREEYGGHLELWNTEMTQCGQRVLPVANRCVIFNTTSISFHGHPAPLSCPDDVERRTLALYYFTVDRPADEVRDPHGTLWQRLPNE